MAKSRIEWCDEVWNPIVGCSRVSPGCDRCYAARLAHRGMTEVHRGLTKLRTGGKRAGVDWNGKIRTVPEKLEDPLRWQRARRVFVNSMSDLFHPGVSFEFAKEMFSVMSACWDAGRRHEFLLLTKRPDRMLDFFSWMSSRVGKWPTWPLPNVWLGVSTEDQATFDERVPKLLRCPAVVHWVSAEPLLEFVDMSEGVGLLDWCVIGGESGPGARKCDHRWIAQMIGNIHGDMPVFVKQLGENTNVLTQSKKGGDPTEWPEDIREREWPNPEETGRRKGYRW